MEDKKQEIIKAAVKLFSKKSFDATSVQEIANACHISKGAFYLHFKSKQELLDQIFQYYCDTRLGMLSSVMASNQSAREKCLQILTFEFQEILDNYDLIMMLRKEECVPNNAKIDHLVTEMQLMTFRHLKTLVSEIYGASIEPFENDITCSLFGIRSAYFLLIIQNQFQLNMRELASFIMNRVDDIAKGLMNSSETPCFTDDVVTAIRNLQAPTKEKLMTEIMDTTRSKTLSNDEKASLDILHAELRLSEPRPAIIKGMTANLQDSNELAVLTNMLAVYVSTLNQ